MIPNKPIDESQDNSNEEIANLSAEIFDESDYPSNNESVDELLSLFTGKVDVSPIDNNWEEEDIELEKTGDLSSLDEAIGNLLDDDFSDRDNNSDGDREFVSLTNNETREIFHTENFASAVADLDSLFDLETPQTNKLQQVNAGIDRDRGQPLEHLLNFNPDLSSNRNFLDDLELFTEEKIEIPYLYDSLEELDALLEQQNPSWEGDDFDRIEKFLDSSPESIQLQPEPSESIAKLTIVEPENIESENFVTIESETVLGGDLGQNRGKKQQVFDETMRVPVKQLNNLSNLIGELVVKRNRLEEDQDRLREFLDNLLSNLQSLNDVGIRMQDLYERSLLAGALLATRNNSRGSFNNNYRFIPEQNQNNSELGALELDKFNDFHLLAQEIMELIVRVRESVSDIQYVVDESNTVTQTLRQVTNQLQEGITSARMVPFAETADRLPRAVRDIARKLNKQAQLNIEGREVSIDKMIVEHLYNPMTHLINNAVAHGIERPDARMKVGKSPMGNVTINAFLQGNQTVITVADDGAGINEEKVKAKALASKLISPQQAQTISQQEVYELLFHPGFSTKDKADDFSGRGVGLDVVTTDLKKIRGSISIDSKLGRGTTFTIRLPLTLSICKALCCVYNNTRIAFPMDGVEGMKEYSPEDVKTNSEGQQLVKWEGALVPFYSVEKFLTFNRQINRGKIYTVDRDDDSLYVVFLQSTGNLLALQVDRVIGEQEIVIKQIEGPVPKSPGIAGATILGDGSVMAIADVLELIEISQGRRSITAGNLWQDSSAMQQQSLPDKTEPLVMVVDDSITVRELLSLSFGKLGYRVEQARDGQEAWDKLRAGLPCDMIFCDIEMPRMNGLELLSNIQKDEKLNQVPIAMLTSRGAEKHRKLAADLGATAYLTKPYTEKDLMDVAKRMLEGEILLSDSKRAILKAKAQQKLEHPEQIKPQTWLKSEPMVLIIDDSVTVRELLAMTYKKAGYQVEQARDGQEAYEKLQSGLPCDLIVCDIEMPRMNGLELLSQLQEDNKLNQIPVAMLTSRGAEKHRKMAADRGAKGYLTKPYIEEVLLDVSKRLMAGEILLDKQSLI